MHRSFHQWMPSLLLCWPNKTVQAGQWTTGKAHALSTPIQYTKTSVSSSAATPATLMDNRPWPPGWTSVYIYLYIYLYMQSLMKVKDLAYTATEKMATLRTSSRQETRRQPSPFYTYVRVRQSITFMIVNIPVTHSLPLTGRELAKKAQFLILSFQYHCYNEIPSRSSNLAHCSTWAIYFIMQTLKELA